MRFQTKLLSLDVLRQDYQKAGYLSSLPEFIGVMVIYFLSPIADFMTTKNILTFTATRKLYITGCFTIMAISGFLIQKATSVTWVVACLTFTEAFASVAF
ncbi:hypothetical protein PR048_000472, partial [Dryococelus australis]